MGTIEAVVKGIDRFIERVSKLTAWLTITLIIIIACDVISRILSAHLLSGRLTSTS